MTLDYSYFKDAEGYSLGANNKIKSLIKYHPTFGPNLDYYTKMVVHDTALGPVKFDIETLGTAWSGGFDAIFKILELSAVNQDGMVTKLVHEGINIHINDGYIVSSYSIDRKEVAGEIYFLERIEWFKAKSEKHIVNLKNETLNVSDFVELTVGELKYLVSPELLSEPLHIDSGKISINQNLIIEIDRELHTSEWLWIKE